MADRYGLESAPLRDGFAQAVREGLARRPRGIPPRYLYDGRGSALFETICRLPEYYLTRIETALLERCADELPAADTVIELGCGHAVKTRIVLDALFRRRPRLLYVPVDISRTALDDAAASLLRTYPGLSVRAIHAEYEQAFELVPGPPALALFLGSNIGNFDPAGARRFLSALRGRSLLVGFDLEKDRAVLRAAYDDPAGVTAAFNLNLLDRINRVLGANFRTGRFRHLALYNEEEHRVEMHLESTARQTVRIGATGQTMEFEEGERLHTENSYKFSEDRIRALAASSGLRVERLWMDDRRWFALALLTS